MRKLRLPRALQTMKFLGAWLVPWSPAFLTQAEPSKLHFFVSCRDGIGRQVAKYGLFEPELTSWIGARLQQMIIVCCLSRSTLKVMSHRSLPERRERLAERTC